MNEPVPTGSLRRDVATVAAAPAPPKSRVANEALAARLDRHTSLGTLWKTEGDRIRCVACGHRCLIGEGRRGICKVRFNQDAQLRVPFGYVAALQCDPVEKKPFFHVHPGCDALTFGMMGCDFHCPYCQNWVTSQALRDEASVAPFQEVAPEQLVTAARELDARLVVASYNEPLITAEWAVAVFLASVSRDIPWHVTAFHKDYKMTEPPNTQARQLIRAAEIGSEEGLRFVYTGNLPGHVGRWENTYCPGCGERLIERFGYLIREYKIAHDGRCPCCETRVPGIWPSGGAADVRTGDGMAAYYSRLPRGVKLN